MRIVVEPLLVSHFGDAIIDEVFYRYKEIISDHISKENTQFIWKFKMCIKHSWTFRSSIYKLPIQAYNQTINVWNMNISI